MPIPAVKNVVVDGVLRYPPTGIKVLLVGAGVAGALAALECWRKGHNVELVERAAGLYKSGDIVVVGPSAFSTLHRYPTMLRAYTETAFDAVNTIYAITGQFIAGPQEFEYARPGVAQHAAYPLRVHSLWGRNDLVEVMHHQLQRLGIHVSWNVNIVDYQDEAGAEWAVAIADDGRRFRADVILAADGIGTKSHKLTLGHPVPAVPTGYTIYRVMFPVASLVDAPLLKKHVEESERAEVRVSIGHDCHCILSMSKKNILIAITVPEEAGSETQESWSTGASIEDLLAIVGNVDAWDPMIVEAVRNTPKNTIIKWQLCMRGPQPKWTSENGRLLQIGDAAHSFIPTSGNGACTAMEDALSVAECLRLVNGKQEAKVGLKVHELLRHQRATLLQRTGFENRRQLHHELEPDTEGIQDKTMNQGKWVWGHNPETYATENFARARAHFESGAPLDEFQNTNLPPGHKFESWTLEEEMAKERAGLGAEDLKLNGDWTLV